MQFIFGDSISFIKFALGNELVIMNSIKQYAVLNYVNKCCKCYVIYKCTITTLTFHFKFHKLLTTDCLSVTTYY